MAGCDRERCVRRRRDNADHSDLLRGGASVVAPFGYTGLLWATLIGWVLWGEIPTIPAFSGITIIVAAGIYLAWIQGAQRRRCRT